MLPVHTFEFAVDRVLSDQILTAWAVEAFGVPDGEVSIGDRHEHFETAVRIVREWQREQSKQYGILVHAPTSVGAGSLETAVALSGLLARSGRCRIIMSDDTLNPYQWVLLDAEETPQWVEVDVEAFDEREVLLVTGPVRGEAEGSICTKEELDIETLRRFAAAAFGVSESSIAIDHGASARREVALTERQYPVIDGAHFRFWYQVTLSYDARTWFAAHERARRWIERMRHFWGEIHVPYALCHPGLERDVRISGGSDSERPCVLIDGATEHWVAFKAPRAGW